MSTFGQRFGELVREKRGIEGLTQEALALKAELRVATVADLENGKSNSPRAKTVDALAVALDITREEIAALRQAAIQPRPSPAKSAGPTISNLPDVPATLFHGRDGYLAQLKEALDKGDAAITQSLQGLGGVGKTTLAIHYARLPEVAARFPIRWWVVAETEQGLEAGFAALGRTVGVAEMQEPDSAAAQKALNWLRAEPRGALILYDNAEDGALLSKWLPGDAASALVTTRISGMAGLTEISLEVWPDDVASAYLMERTGQEDAEAALKLAHSLGGLPLACEQAAAYVVETGETLAGYLARFEASPKRMTARKATGAAHENTVATTFALAIERAAADCAAAPVVLSVMAELADAPLPVAVFGQKDAPKGLQEAEEVADAIDALARWALIARMDVVDALHDVRTPCLDLHRLIRIAASEEKQNYLEDAINTLSGSFPGDETSNVASWAFCSLLAPHVCTNWFMRKLSARAKKSLLHIFDRYATYLQYSLADYSTSDSYFRMALRIAQCSNEISPADKSRQLMHLAGVQINLGGTKRLNDARMWLSEALNICREIYEPKHPEIGICLSNFGDVLLNLGGEENLLEAAVLLEEAHEIAELPGQPEYPSLANRKSNFASILMEIGGETNLIMALQLLEEALEIVERNCRPDHPHVALCLTNMSNALERRGKADDLTKALELLERALNINELNRHSRHPDIGRVCGLIARVIFEIGDLDSYNYAKEMAERSVRILEESLGINHIHARKARNIRDVFRTVMS